MNLKKLNWYIYPLAGFILVILFSCELPDSGRMAVIDFNFNQPDILREAETQSVPDRIIPMESKTVVVVMYPSFAGDNIMPNVIPSQINLNKAVSQPGARTLYINYNLTFSGNSLGNIEPGIWNFVVLTFDFTVTDIRIVDTAQALTFNNKKNVEIQAGLNLVDLPLLLNIAVYYDLGSGEGPINAKNASGSVSQADIPKETVFIGLTNFDKGENRVFFNPEDLVINTTTITLYTKEGYILNSIPISVSHNLSYFAFNATGPTDMIHFSARKELLGVLTFGYNDPGNYFPGPPHNLGNLTISIMIEDPF